jgi:hypothetical protein
MEFFLHPWFMAAGGALISSPILIHLINRMRFRRIRWAAMEFLLKSQKRNRRRLIIEQLILLFLRILLVLLAAFLVARFIYAGINPDKVVTHLVLFDDSLSMQDRGREGTAFEEGQQQIIELARSAAGSPLTHKMQVRMLSRMDTVIFAEELKDATVENLEGVLSQHKPTFHRGAPLAALEKAKAFFANIPEGQKVFDFVSDFREHEWVTGPDVEKINQLVTDLQNNNIHINWIDVAGPTRGKSREVAPYHNNLAIVDVRPEARMAAEQVPVDFTVDIKNFGDSTASTFLKVKIDGAEDFSAAQPVSNIPAGATRRIRFPLLFTKKHDTDRIQGSDDNAERDRKRRMEREFRRVTVEISRDEVGLNADNVRDVVMEVRRKVPTLVVTGSGPESRLPGGGVFHVMVAFFAARSYDVELRTLDELAKTDLDLYPSIFLLNMPEISDEALLEKLNDYVLNGGSIAYFMGERTKAPFYNEILHRKYKGLFPVLLEDRPTDPLNPRGRLSPDERQALRQEKLQRDKQPKIVFREQDQDHPIISTLYKNRSVFQYLGIDRYYKTLDQAEWDPRGERTRVVVRMPNSSSVDDYKATADSLSERAVNLTEELADKDKTFQPYLGKVQSHRREVRNVLARPNAYLFDLIEALEGLLKDPGDKDNPKEDPDLRNLWAQASMKGLKQDIENLLEKLSYGDPLVVTGSHGRGRVCAILTSAGTEWNDWGTGSMASWTYPVFMMDLQRYLVSEGDDFNRLIGENLKLVKSVEGYDANVGRKFSPQAPPQVEEGKEEALPEIVDQGRQPLRLDKDLLTFDFQDSDLPGVYTFEFYPKAGGDGAAPPAETLAYAYNVDPQESDLKRAARAKLERKPSDEQARVGTVVLRTPGDTYSDYKDRDPDASESPWLFLFILLILVVEQALAVHLSFHLKESDTTPAPAPPRVQPAAA